MKLKQIFSFLLGVILLINLAPQAAIASENQSNQDLNKTGVLVAPDPDFEINVYPKPGMKRRRIGFGLGGDHVTVSEQVGSNEGYSWDYVKFEKAPYTEGWIRGDYVSFENVDNSQKSTGNKQNNYQVDQKNRSGKRNSYLAPRETSSQGNQRQNNYSQTQGNYRNQ